MSELRPGEITDEMRQAMNTAPWHRFSNELRALAATIRFDAEGRYAGAEPGWRAGVEWTLLWDREHRQPADRRQAVGSGAGGRQGVSPE
ncbi:hypothetical protein [Streptomyces sp. NPDC006368]|uniref:hypothetical protein n=1 Tax=Streptomyces sp. NPDC006368 TaxID=3156760 RepID=UPI0033BDDF51